MISLRDKVVGESIISSTKAGRSGVLERAEEWLKERNIRNYEINDDGKFEIWEREIIITEPIPDFVNIKKVRTIALKTKEALQGNMPEQARELIIKDIDIDDFGLSNNWIKELEEKIKQDEQEQEQILNERWLNFLNEIPINSREQE